VLPFFPPSALASGRPSALEPIEVPPAMQALYRDVALGGPVGNARHGWSLTRVALLRDAATQHVCCH
jgi:hypothetical protein